MIMTGMYSIIILLHMVFKMFEPYQVIMLGILCILDAMERRK